MTDVIVLAGADERDLTQLDEYREVGGYAQLERARGMAPCSRCAVFSGITESSTNVICQSSMTPLASIAARASAGK